LHALCVLTADWPKRASKQWFASLVPGQLDIREPRSNGRHPRTVQRSYATLAQSKNRDCTHNK